MAMNMLPSSALSENPFTHATTFWGREHELLIIKHRLSSTPPQCCAIVGETFIGKSTLLHHLANPRTPTLVVDQEKGCSLTFVYLDCRLSIDLAQGDYAAVQFWWELYHETKAKLPSCQQPELVKPSFNAQSKLLIDAAYEFKFTLEELVRNQSCTVVFVLDNFEIVARLDPRNSEWLRSMMRSNCALVVSSRHLLYLLYQYHNLKTWSDPSPLFNLFSDPIYLGLMTEDEVQKSLVQARELARGLGSEWSQQDLHFVRDFCGRHAELIRIACKNLFKYRLQSDQSGETNKKERENNFLKLSISSEANAICTQLWHGLADPELSDVPRMEESTREKDGNILSPHQLGVIDIANGKIPSDNILFILEQRSLIEQTEKGWRVFAEVMRLFIRDQEHAYSLDRQLSPQKQISTTSFPPSMQGEVAEVPRTAPSFTYLEGKVYDYLKSREGRVCDREDIMQAVWGESNLPSNTALQKVIERIREKIEPDADNPRYLIAIRGQGYMLREIPSPY